MKEGIKKRLWRVALCGFCATATQAQVSNYLFSTDIGSDLDISDPNTQGTMDAGAIYTPRGSAGHPALWKGDGGGTSSWPGHPFSGKGGGKGFPPNQPPPGEIGRSSVSDYTKYFDLDAEDQVLNANVVGGSPTTLGFLEASGIYSIHRSVKFSFDDDGAAGWAVSGNVPTTANPFHTNEIYGTALALGGFSSAITSEVDEVQLQLDLNPIKSNEFDDDVDALDWHPMEGDPTSSGAFKARFFSSDHEANLNLDPGDIYLTERNGGENITLAFDDVNDIGLLDETDIDAFEFVAIDGEWAKELDIRLNEDEWTVGLIFSVDEDDPDTVGIDESGGLNPNMIYLSDLNGNYISASAGYQEDIDALTVIPEPAAIALIGLFGGGMFFFHRLFKK